MLKSPRAALPNHGHPLARGLVGCWLFNEGVGDKLFDLSGYGNHILLDGPVWKNGSLRFDGDDDIGQFANIPIGDSDFTLVADVFLRSVPESRAIIYLELVAGGEKNMIYLNRSPQKIGFDNFPPTAGQVTSSNFYTLNARNNLVWTRRGDIVSFYIDGIFGGSGTQDTYEGAPPTIAIIGAEGFPPGGPYGRQLDGDINYMYIYDYAFSNFEVFRLYLDPYAMFDRRINPAVFYAPPVAGIPIPVVLNLFNQARL